MNLAPRIPDPPVQGIAAGYEVRSTLAFETLRPGTGTPLFIDERLDLERHGELLRVWQPRPGNPFQGRLIRSGDQFAFWASDAGWYLIDPNVPSVSVSPAADPLRRELRLFGVPASICGFFRGDLSIHASAVEVSGRGVLLAGPSHYGKTTLAGAFAGAGHRLLSEDSTLCRPGSAPVVFPGPAALRLRADVAPRLPIPDGHRGPAEEGRVPVVFDRLARGDGEPVPLRAILVLREGVGPAYLESVPRAEAVRDLLALTFQLPDAASRAATFERLSDLASRVRVLNLERPITIDALAETVAVVEREILQ